MTMVTADMLRRGRDLADQDESLKAERDGLIFMETSPRQPPITLYAMSDGEPIPMSPDLARLAIKKRYKGGGYMFTDKPDEAPAYQLGAVKCFLHPDAAERPVLDEIGLAGTVCHSEHLASLYSKRIHGQRRHRQEWETLQEYRKEQDTLTERAERREQLAATLALAGRAAAPVVAEPVVDDGVRHDCAECGWKNEKNTAQGLVLHKRRFCQPKEELVKEKADAGSPPLDEAQH